MSLARSMAQVGAATALSRLLGFVRDLLIAILLGAGPAADAFVVAFRLPNLVRRVIAEGALNSAYMPVAAALHPDDQPRFAGRIAVLFGLGGFAVALVLILAMPLVMHLLAPGFAEDDLRWTLAVMLTRLTTPSLAFMALLAVLAAVLNADNRFSESALAPVLLNVLLIGVLAVLLVHPPSTESAMAMMLAVGLTVASLVQVLVLVRAVRRGPLRLVPEWPRLKGAEKRFFVLLGPSLVTGALAQVQVLVATIIASAQPSAVSWLYYADRLYQLPLSITGIAMSVVLMPVLVAAVQAGDMAALHRTQNRALEGALALALPAATGLAVLARPIVAVLFEHGAFSAEDGAATAAALAAFACGLPPFAVSKVLAPAFFAREQGRAPLVLALVSLAVCVGLSLVLSAPMGATGLALAASLSGFAYALGLGVLAGREGLLRLGRGDVWLALRLVAATALMALALGLVLRLGAPASKALMTLWLAGLIGLGLAVYAAALWLLGARGTLAMIFARPAS